MTSATAVSQIIPFTLTEESLTRGLRFLARRDRDLARVCKRLGAPPMWERAEGFPTLVHIILEQQVSLASARASFGRLVEAAAPLMPQSLLEFDDEELRRIGFSRQKALYARGLARAIVDGQLDLAALHGMDDMAARVELTRVKGIGAWTADIYLLMALRRPDAWPAGDLALAVALQDVKSLPARPTHVEIEALAEPWRPWRAVAARLLWSHYLDNKAAPVSPPRIVAETAAGA